VTGERDRLVEIAERRGEPTALTRPPRPYAPATPARTSSAASSLAAHWSRKNPGCEYFSLHDARPGAVRARTASTAEKSATGAAAS